MSDNEMRRLVDRCLQGDELAMRDLVWRYRAAVFGLCYRMLGQLQDAEDAAQETFLRALRHLRHWDRQRDLRPWLLRIAANRCRTALAKRLRTPPTHTLAWEPPDDSPSQQSANQLAEEVDRALAQIRIDYREAFLLFHQQGLSYAQIATYMKCPLGTVKTWVHRARQELIRRLIRRDVIQERKLELRRV